MASLQLHMNGDGYTFPVNSDLNRHILAADMVAEGDVEVTPTMCGFILLFMALTPGSEEHVKADKVASKLYADSQMTMKTFVCRAEAMRIKIEDPDLFKEMGKEAVIMLKHCVHCGRNLPMSQFLVYNTAPNEPTTHCSVCYRRTLRPDLQERFRAHAEAWR